MELNVAVIGPAHALKGEVRLEIRTSDPQGRLAVGNTLPTRPAANGPLTVERLRYDGRYYFAKFAEVNDRTRAEQLRGTMLVVETDDDEESDEEGWYAHELIGLEAQTEPGEVLGEVVDLIPGIAQDRLVVLTEDDQRVEVPFVEAIVTEIDVEAQVVVINPPGGLFPGLGQAEDAR